MMRKVASMSRALALKVFCGCFLCLVTEEFCSSTGNVANIKLTAPESADALAQQAETLHTKLDWFVQNARAAQSAVHGELRI
jgi:hypothetical protein